VARPRPLVAPVITAIFPSSVFAFIIGSIDVYV
jgi:hypothetical protein